VPYLGRNPSAGGFIRKCVAPIRILSVPKGCYRRPHGAWRIAAGVLIETLAAQLEQVFSAPIA